MTKLKTDASLLQSCVSESTFGYIIIDKKGKPLLKDAQIPIYWLKKIAIEELEKFKETTVKKVVIIDSALTIPDIRNKLSPITTLISMLEKGELELAKQSIKQCKISINYLAQREVYSH